MMIDINQNFKFFRDSGTCLAYPYHTLHASGRCGLATWDYLIFFIDYNVIFIDNAPKDEFITEMWYLKIHCTTTTDVLKKDPL